MCGLDVVPTSGNDLHAGQTRRSTQSFYVPADVGNAHVDDRVTTDAPKRREFCHGRRHVVENQVVEVPEHVSPQSADQLDSEWRVGVGECDDLGWRRPEWSKVDEDVFVGERSSEILRPQRAIDPLEEADHQWSVCETAA